jgi:hypothetical protein
MYLKSKTVSFRLLHLPPVPISSIIASFGVALVFFFMLHNFSYLQFPKQVVTFKGDRDKAVSDLEKNFSVAAEPDRKSWVLEVEFFEPAQSDVAFHILINGTPVEIPKVKGKRLGAEFPSSVLKEGNNILEIGAEASWAFRRVRIKNIYGYSSGFLSAVVFKKNNVYSDAQMFPSSALHFLLLILFSLATFALSVISSARTDRPHPILRALRHIRFAVPGLFLVIILLPIFSKYRAAVALGSVLWLLVVFFALAFVFELKSALSFVFRKISSLVGILSAAGKRAWSLLEKEELVSGILILAFLFICLIYPGPGQKKGDSLEYYAMLVSWAEYSSPYITKESCVRMQERLGEAVPSGESTFFRWMKEKFPGLLKSGREMDLPHFWFYSLGAAVFYWPLRFFSLNIGLCFMLLHVALLLAAFFLIRRRLGPAAAQGLFFLIFCSPLFWFINKASVEFFTVILTFIGITLLVTDDYAAAAFSFAVASTQNPPFAILCFLTFVFGFLRKKWAFVKGRNLFLWIAAVLLAALHPAYYYLRLGVLNPVLAIGGASLYRDVFSLKRMFCFIFDPDIGLLSNWPLALALLLTFAFLALKKKARLTRQMAFFLIISALVLLWSQSRTSNLNHGGTYHISRYALWFLYIFFLLAWQTGLYFSSVKRPAKRAFIGAVVLLGLVEAVHFWPGRLEVYLQPTWASRLLYDRWPGLYDPMPEIFIERCRGKERDLPESVWAVSNPSGNKILILRGRTRNIRSEKDIPPIETCPALDRVLVYREARKRLALAPRKSDLYINGMGNKFLPKG